MKKIILATLAALLVFAPAAALAPAASAISLGSSCTDNDVDATSPPAVWGGGVGNSDAREVIGSPSYGATAYEWFGNEGLVFTTSTAVNDKWFSENTKADCGLGGYVSRAAVGVADIGWLFVKTTVAAGLSVLEAGQSLTTLSLVSKTLAEPLTFGVGDQNGLSNVFNEGLIIAVLLVAAYAGYKIIRGRLKEAITGSAWTVAAAVVGLLLLSSPLWLSQQVVNLVKLASGPVQSITADIATNLSAEGTQINTLCQLDAGIGDGDIEVTRTLEDGSVVVEGANVPNRGVRESTCALWTVGLYQPWLLGQFGTTAAPVAETHFSDDARWSESQNSQLAVTIPGLANQPEAGDLSMLQLAWATRSPAEQRWFNQQVATSENPSVAARNADALLIGGAEGISDWCGDDCYDGNPYDSSDRSYPLAEIAAIGGVDAVGLTGANSYGHQMRWDVLRNRVTETSQAGVSSVWTGGGADASTFRWQAVGSGLVAGVLLVVPSAVFGFALLWYQLALGLLLAFLGLALLGTLIPNYGAQVARDYLNKVLKYMLFMVITLGFSIVSPLLAIGLPNLLIPGETAVGGAGGLATLSLKASLGFVVLAVSLIAWYRIVKGARAKTLVKGANERSVWTPTERAADASREVAKKTAAATAVVGAAVVTGGAAAAAAGGSMAAGAATAGRIAATQAVASEGISLAQKAGLGDNQAADLRRATSNYTANQRSDFERGLAGDKREREGDSQVDSMAAMYGFKPGETTRAKEYAKKFDGGAEAAVNFVLRTRNEEVNPETAPPKAEPADWDARQPSDEPPKQEAPKQEAPKQEQPKQEQPKQEAPKQERPKPAPEPTMPTMPTAPPVQRKVAKESGDDQ